MTFCHVTGIEKALCEHCQDARKDAMRLAGEKLRHLPGISLVPKESGRDGGKRMEHESGIDAMRRKAFSKEASLAIANMDEASLSDAIEGSAVPGDTPKAMEEKRRQKSEAAFEAIREAVAAERETMANEEDLGQRQQDDAAIAARGEYRVALDRALPKLGGAHLDDALRILKSIAGDSIKKRAARPPQAKAS